MTKLELSVVTQTTKHEYKFCLARATKHVFSVVTLGIQFEESTSYSRSMGTRKFPQAEQQRLEDYTSTDVANMKNTKQIY